MLLVLHTALMTFIQAKIFQDGKSDGLDPTHNHTAEHQCTHDKPHPPMDLEQIQICWIVHLPVLLRVNVQSHTLSFLCTKGGLCK